MAQRPSGSIFGWGSDPAAVVQPATGGEVARGEAPGQALPAGRYNWMVQWAALTDLLTINVLSPDDVALLAPGLVIREQGGTAQRGSVTGTANGLALNVINQATQWVDFAPRIEARGVGSPAEASSVGGVTYGYSTAGSTCRFTLSGLDATVLGSAVQASVLSTVPYPSIPGSSGFIRWRLDGLGPDRGSAIVSGARTVVGFYRIDGNITIPIQVDTASIELRTLLVRHQAGSAPVAVTTVGPTTYAVGGHTITITPPSSGDLDVTDGAQYFVEIAYSSGSGTAYVEYCRYNLVKRGIE
jgi:hypothetical protein